MTIEKKKVKEFIAKDCSISLFEELASQSDYYQKCYDFYFENKDKNYEDLSFKQKSWLIKIKDGLIEEASK